MKTFHFSLSWKPGRRAPPPQPQPNSKTHKSLSYSVNKNNQFWLGLLKDRNGNLLRLITMRIPPTEDMFRIYFLVWYKTFVSPSRCPLYVRVPRVPPSIIIGSFEYDAENGSFFGQFWKYENGKWFWTKIPRFCGIFSDILGRNNDYSDNLDFRVGEVGRSVTVFRFGGPRLQIRIVNYAYIGVVLQKLSHFKCMKF